MSSGFAAERSYIFISYRRDDARGASGRVWDWLRIGFGRERMFRDVASIGAGKWRQKIEQALAISKACVAVIGRRWADANNLPRLQDPNDMVRHELETALASGDQEQLTVIPLLVEDAQLAQIPTGELPQSLRPLLGDWNVMALSESGWDDDMRRLIEAIADATGLPVNPELDEWMALMAGAQQSLSAARGKEASGAVGRQGEEQALESLLHHAAGADPEERPALKAALAALAAGNTLLAEASFEQEVEASRRLRLAAEQLAAGERRRESDAARNVASLAVVRGDLNKAVSYFQMALEANHEDLDAALQLGDAWIRRGELSQASTVFADVIHQARDGQDPRLEGRGLNGRGDVLLAQGDSPGALAAYQASLAIAEGLAKREPAHTLWQRDLSVSHDRIGDVLLAQGDSPGALTAYQASLAIAEGLAKRDPANTQWQRDLSVSHDRIGNVLVAQGDGPGALAAYQAALTIAEGLAKRDPANTEWQRDLSVSHGRIGDVLLAQGDSPGALAAYQAALTIAEGLAKRNPANTQWQRDLSVSHDRIGDVLVSQGDGAGALAVYQAGLTIREVLAKRDPANTEWQRDLSISYEKIGDVLLKEGNNAGALDAYQGGLRIAEGLAILDPANTQWQSDISMCQEKIGDVMLSQGDDLGALAAHQAGLAIREDLVAHDPVNMDWQRDLFVSHERIGVVLAALGDGPGAQAAHQTSLSIQEGLARRDKPPSSYE
jgi:predicted negative regulator of RcsB-dependent stress response